MSKQTQNAWKTIARMGWNKNANYGDIAKTFYKELGKQGMKRLEQFVSGRGGELYEAVEDYGAQHSPLEVGSDDSFSDLRYHVVGLGQAEFERNLVNPKLMAERYAKGDYKESFIYCFQEPDPPRTEADKEEAVQALFQAVAELDRELAKINTALAAVQGVLSRTVMLADIVKKDKETA